jgi:membrane-bound inhibitor of C-type lysozyme
MSPRHLIIVLVTAFMVIGAPPAPAQTLTTYYCRDGTEFVVAFFKDERVARLQLDGKAVALRRRVSVAGSRYSGSGITLRLTKSGTTLTRGGQSTDCSAT